MNKAVAVIIVAVVLVSSISIWLLYPRGPQTSTFIDDFEKDMEEWSIDADVPEDPNNPGQLVQWKIERSTNQSVSGAYSVLLAIDGRQDDGAIWMKHKLSLQPDVKKTVNVTFQFWSPTESFNTIAVVVGYLGGAEPQAEGDFQIIEAANQIGGWKTCTFGEEIKTDANGALYVALGIAVRWETTMEYLIDDVNITVK